MNEKFLIIPTVLLSAIGCSAKQEQKPNVIIILADDLGYGDVSAYGNTTISTPNIDKLANGGVCFNNGYATSATSTPSRYALFTGMYPWKNKRAKILPGDAPLIIDENQPTLPKMMQHAGYATAAIGKWHLGMGMGNIDWNQTITPNANSVGFDYSCLVAATNDRVPTVYVENGKVVGLETDDPIEVSYKQNFPGEPTALTNPEMLRMRWHHGHNQSIVNGIPRIGFMKGGQKARWIDEEMADYFADKVKGFLHENKDKPFFLYYGLHQPHVPRTPNSRFVGATTMGPRGDAIVEADWCVGALLAELENLDILDNTLVIFSSDNGPVLQDGYYDDCTEKVGEHQPAGGLRGGKYSLFDGGTRVPFFVYWRGTIKPMVSDALVCHLDLFASIGKLIHAHVPAELDSKEILSALMGKNKKGRSDLVLEAQGKLAFRSGNYALIPPYKGPKSNITGNELGNLEELSLFDLKSDFGQVINIADKSPALTKKLLSDFLNITEGYYKPEVKEVELK
ncbi:MAG: sulfatase-like hydrolase/transferase [Pigmentiphaga sp.]|nr:sulfatase-like hydrolase/transferase [Pigmentiphaga sp.]